MAHQSPMISIPKKTTDEVDWTTPIRALISQSYGESPDNYAAECAALQRCRQDAVKGAGSDITARDLLYKYFGQLELLELRFSEIRVTFPWHDAFTSKLITQTSIAYEKASILFQIAATHSAIAAAQTRSDPEGLKCSFNYFRTCAGMLVYVNENFLHAPSTDLSREVVKFLVNLILAQATEVFLEKCIEEKKGSALVCRVGAQTAFMYSSLCEEVKEFMGKGIFDRNWVTLIQIKSKYYFSISQYYRGLADSAAGKYGDALVRFTLAESTAKEASKTASSFSSLFVTHMSPNLPADAGPSIQERTKAHLALCTERQAEAQRENDLVYNAVLPAVDALPAIDKASVATPIPIQEVYGKPDVQKVIGTDLFIKLIPLSVHESASVYSEEKAKLVRGEVEKAESVEGEVRSALDVLGVKEGLVRFKAMAEGEVGGGDEVPLEVRRWRDDINLVEEREGVEGHMGKLNILKEGVRRGLEGVSRELEIESRDCEMMRVKYDHLWNQEPSATLTKSLRQDLKSHFGALEAAAMSDQQVMTLWDSVKGDIRLLLSPEIEAVFRASTECGGSAGEHLLDLDVGNEANEAHERARIGQYVVEIEERLGRLNKIARERAEVLKDLKDKIQTDDVSHLLLLNRRNSGVEPTLFAAELEKFRPYQQRLASTVHHQQLTIQEVSSLWKELKSLAGRGPGVRKWDEREKKKKDTVRRFSRARDGYMEVRDGIAKGLQFYTELTELSRTLERNTKDFISSRTVERNTLVAQAETQKQRSASSGPPPLAEKPRLPPPPPPLGSNLDSSFASLNLRGGPSPPQGQSQWGSDNRSSQPSQQTYGNAPSHDNSPPAPQSQPYRTLYVPPPPPPQSSQPSYASAPPTGPYAGLEHFMASSQNHSSSPSLPTIYYPPQGQPPYSQAPQQQKAPQRQSSYPQSSHGQPPYPQPPQRQPSYPPPPPSQPSYRSPDGFQFPRVPSLPPPPPPLSYQYGPTAPSTGQNPGTQQQQNPHQSHAPQPGYGGQYTQSR